MKSRSDLARAALVLAIALGLAAPAGAADPKKERARETKDAKESKDEPEAVQKARAEFVAATDHVKNARWGEALAAFERSAALRPHALTTYNIGACERALGRYTRARDTLGKALESDAAAGKRELPKSFAEDAQRWLAEIDGILVRAAVTLAPEDATLLVDGAPLSPGRDAGVLVAGLPPSGKQVTTPGARFTLVVDPGDHLFAISRAGYTNAVITRSLAAGSKPAVTLDLQGLPATIKISANRPGAVVAIDDLDVGVAPVEVSRPAGTYKVLVRKSGFVPYSTTVHVNRGDNPSLQAPLPEESHPITKKPVFWVGALAVVAGAVTATYFLTRPDPERPTPDGGGLGWVVSVPAPGSR